MTCGHCVSAVEKALRATDGVQDARVNLEKGSAEVDHTDEVQAPQLVAAVEEEGYTARVG